MKNWAIDREKVTKMYLKVFILTIWYCFIVILYLSSLYSIEEYRDKKMLMINLNSS
jgi:hypothetical protein